MIEPQGQISVCKLKRNHVAKGGMVRIGVAISFKVIYLWDLLNSCQLCEYQGLNPGVGAEGPCSRA